MILGVRSQEGKCNYVPLQMRVGCQVHQLFGAIAGDPGAGVGSPRKTVAQVAEKRKAARRPPFSNAFNVSPLGMTKFRACR